MALDSGDAMLDRFTGELVYGWLVEGVLTWLEIGDPARDEEAIERAATMLRAIRSSLLARVDQPRFVTFGVRRARRRRGSRAARR